MATADRILRDIKTFEERKAKNELTDGEKNMIRRAIS